ncbi:MAG TPA: hypothetical protein PLY23_00535 [Alphaproteobacteria bacterium]|nr:hypothetical protein [Alphaproteobacteria bacterium]HQS93075.1 hypothetical protein [Alphaproteobacteria bacterium]
MSCEEKDFIPITPEKKSIKDLEGILKKPFKPLSSKEMDDIIRNHITEEVLENGFL